MPTGAIRPQLRLIFRPLQHRSMTTRPATKNPLILILGATGTGKSDLAIQIAQHLSQRNLLDSNSGYNGAEIINADAMQLYRGLPIITNKVTLAEQQGIPHHLLDYIGLEEEPWTIQRYVKEADRVITEIGARDKVPIVVGGTSYYVYGLLLQHAMLEEGRKGRESIAAKEDTAGFGKDAGLTWPILTASTQDIYAKLQEMDPEQAKKWHPNDRRRIQRSLEICLRSGQKTSEIYKQQKLKANQLQVTKGRSEAKIEDVVSDMDASLRYDPIIFWLEAEPGLLKDRLNRRVDNMVKNGLLAEAKDLGQLERQMQEKNAPLDKSKGIWVSIGYKEMKPWVQAMHNQKISEKELGILRDSCIEAVKAGTRQYAKRQNRFIRIRLTNALINADAKHILFLLDCTNLEQWLGDVQQPALKMVDSFLHGQVLPNPSDLSPLAQNTFASMTTSKSILDRSTRSCETCDKVLMDEKEWIRHLNSHSHKRTLQGIRKRELNEARRRASQTTGDFEPG